MANDSKLDVEKILQQLNQAADKRKEAEAEAQRKAEKKKAQEERLRIDTYR